MTTKAGSATNGAADTVRRYLTFLASPDQLIDSGLVEKLEKRLEAETDQLERLKIHSAIEIARNVDAESLTESFVKVAGDYAKQESIPATAFLSMGVPKDVLVRAGLLSGKSGKKTTRKAGQRTVRTSGMSSGKGAVVASAREFSGYFTIKDLVDSSGASLGTVRKAVDEMIQNSQLAEFDPDPQYSGRGRAPKRYKLI